MKYIWDDVKLLNIRNEVSNVGIKVGPSSTLESMSNVFGQRVGLGMELLHSHPYTLCTLAF